MKIKTLSKITKIIISLTSVLAISLLVSLILYFSKDFGKSYMFIFPQADENKYIVEKRFLKENPASDEITYYVDELLLGSSMERTKKIVTPGTKVLSCFERKGVLYLDLSDNLLHMGKNVLDIQEGFELIELNVKKNFKQINSIMFFVNGIYAYEKIQQN